MACNNPPGHTFEFHIRRLECVAWRIVASHCDLLVPTPSTKFAPDNYCHYVPIQKKMFYLNNQQIDASDYLKSISHGIILFCTTTVYSHLQNEAQPDVLFKKKHSAKLSKASAPWCLQEDQLPVPNSNGMHSDWLRQQITVVNILFRTARGQPNPCL